MKRISFLFLSFLTVFLISCEKEIQVEIADNEPKIVLSAHFGAGESINAYLSSSIPLYNLNNGQINYIDNALVEVSSDNLNWKILSYDISKKIYSLTLSEFNIKEGGTYYVKASANGYKAVKSYCSIPVYNPVQLTLAKIDTNGTDIDMGMGTMTFSIKVKDATGQKNYYGIEAYMGEYQISLENNNKWVFSDNSGDGCESIFNYKTYYWHHGDILKIRLYQTNEAFYLFHFSYANYVSDNPFAEPSPIYSNIENGLGICSGYTYRDYFFTIP